MRFLPEVSHSGSKPDFIPRRDELNSPDDRGRRLRFKLSTRELHWHAPSTFALLKAQLSRSRRE
jgi:hypothetical protein